MNDGSFLAALKQSDDMSWIYHDYYDKLYKYIFYRTGDPVTTEDLVSEVFVKALDKYHTYDPKRGKFSTWIYTIANNTVINHRSKMSRYTTLDIKQTDFKYRLEDAVMKKELKETLLQALMKLDERQRNVIALKFAACESNREIARILNLSESNVGTILYRSLKQLRDILKEQGVAYEPELQIGV